MSKKKNCKLTKKEIIALKKLVKTETKNDQAKIWNNINQEQMNELKNAERHQKMFKINQNLIEKFDKLKKEKNLTNSDLINYILFEYFNDSAAR